jgi:hypothetical protein
MADGALTPVHRRVWRLAFLLTGNGPAATALIDQLRRTRRDPASLEPALLDRVIIQNSRSLPKAAAVVLPTSPSTPFGSTGPAAEALAAALRLPRQPLEAWVLRRLDDLDELHIARAMDCSKSAARLHLNSADETMASRLGPGLTAAVSALKKYADSLDPEPFILAHRDETRARQKARLRRIALMSGAIALILLFILLKILVSQSS